MRTEDIEKRLPEVIDALFEGKVNVFAPVESMPSDSAIDVVFQPNSSAFEFGVVAVSSGRSLVVKSVLAKIRSIADTRRLVPVIAVPYVSDKLRAELATNGICFIDLSGNAYIRSDDLLIDVRGRPNKFPEIGRPSSPFTTRSSQIARILLTRPNRWWHQFDLADVAVLSKSQISKTVSRLLELELVEQREDKAIRAVDSWDLLDAWVADYPEKTTADMRYGHLNASGLELMRVITGKLNGSWIDHAFTGLASAYAYEQFTTFRIASLYVPDIDEAENALKLRGDERGANVQLLTSSDPAVVFGANEQLSIRCVSVVQTYLDLQNMPERAAEAAEHLRRHALAEHFATVKP